MKELIGKIECALTPAEVQKLPLTEQADAAYALLGKVADALADFGYDPGVVADVVLDLGLELWRRDGAPRRVVRLDPRRPRRDDADDGGVEP